jgi:hypothetical protein
LSTQEEENDVEFHSPRKASIKSAILPGLGQIYNEKYWKVPVVYIGLGVSAYYIDYNNGLFKTYKKALIAELDDDPLTINDSGFSSSQLDELQDTYRRWRDLSWVALSAVYLLNIIDANVDAHLFHFDVGEELGMSILPYVSPSTQINTGVTLSLNF